MTIDPVMFEIGPFVVRWYGFFMSLSAVVGFCFFYRHGRRLGVSEDHLYNIAIVVIICGLVGARALYVLTNLDFFYLYPGEIIRIDHGGLSFHGGIAGGFLGGVLYAVQKGLHVDALSDGGVPTLTIGYTLVRIGNAINREVMGRPTEAFLFDRHPAQLYGAAIGLVLLVVHNALARRNPPPGYLFWSYILYYSILRAVVEEPFRDNPLYAIGYVNETYGFGLFTLTHLVTPVLLLLAYSQRRRVYRR